MPSSSLAKRAVYAAVVCLLAVGLGPNPGCTEDILANLTRATIGTISVGLINDTPFRAILTYGTYNPENQFSIPDIRQVRLEAGEVHSIQEPACRRRIGVATEDLILRLIRAEVEVVDDEALHSGVFFSAAPLGDPLEAEPTAGTAPGREEELGLDYPCGGLLIYTFREDLTNVGGFRIDFQIVP